MGVFTFEAETTSVILPAKLFKAFIVDADNLIPKVAPLAVESAENFEGNGGPGTIKKITFSEGSQFKYVKHRIDEVDEENFTYGYTVIEGDALSALKLEKICNEIKIVAAPDGGSILKSTSKYHTNGDHEIKEEQFMAGKENAEGVLKAVESYLLANPEEYN